MRVETLSEIKGGGCNQYGFSPDMFQAAVKIAKEVIGLSERTAAKKIKYSFDRKYEGNWVVIVGKRYGMFMEKHDCCESFIIGHPNGIWVTIFKFAS